MLLPPPSPLHRWLASARRLLSEARLDGELPPLVEFNPNHDARGRFASKRGGAAGGLSVPPEPGTLPLPPGHVRAYHYTDSLDAVLETGLSTEFARGEQYGEPNAIWLSAEKPGDWKDYVEVHVRPDEIGIGGPWGAEKWSQQQIDTFMARGSNFTLKSGTLAPDRFVTHHRPWHDDYRGLMRDYGPGTKAGRDALADGSFEFLATFSGGKMKPALDAWKASFSEARLDGELPPLVEFNPYHDERGRFTTKGGRGAMLDNRTLASKVAAGADEGGGSFTLGGGSPTTGIMVSYAKKDGHSRILEAKTKAERDAAIRDWVAEQRKFVRSNKDNHYGVWVDSGKTYLDVSRRFPKTKRDAAVKAGKDQNQIAVFDLDTFTEIGTGGTGE